MIVLTGLLLAVCLVGAWLAITLDANHEARRTESTSHPEETWWSQVETGPDSNHPDEP